MPFWKCRRRESRSPSQHARTSTRARKSSNSVSSLPPDQGFLTTRHAAWRHHFHRPPPAGSPPRSGLVQFAITGKTRGISASRSSAVVCFRRGLPASCVILARRWLALLYVSPRSIRHSHAWVAQAMPLARPAVADAGCLQSGRSNQPPPGKPAASARNQTILVFYLATGLGLDQLQASACLAPRVLPRRWLGTGCFSTSHRSPRNAGGLLRRTDKKIAQRTGSQRTTTHII